MPAVSAPVELGLTGRVRSVEIFVAGGTGVLGRAVVRELVRAGHKVRATARGEDKAAQVRALGAEPVAVDLYNRDSIRAALNGAGALLRLTTKIPPLMQMRRASAWRETIRLRTQSAEALVDAALATGVKTYLHESVAFIYRDGGEDWIDETHPLDVEGSSILAGTFEGERHAKRFADAGRCGVVLRFGSFYAPESSQTATMARLMRLRMLPVPGPGDHYFSSIYVSDAARAVVAALEVPSGTYNAVDDEPLRYGELMDSLAAAVGAPRPMRLPRAVGSALLGRQVARYLLRSQRVSNTRLREASGWAPQVKSGREGWRIIARAGAVSATTRPVDAGA